MEKLEILVPNVIPRAFIAVTDLLERDSSQFLWKIQRNLENLSLVVTSVPAKSKEVSCQPIRAPGTPASEGLLRIQPTLPRTPVTAGPGRKERKRSFRLPLLGTRLGTSDTDRQRRQLKRQSSLKLPQPYGCAAILAVGFGVRSPVWVVSPTCIRRHVPVRNYIQKTRNITGSWMTECTVRQKCSAVIRNLPSQSGRTVYSPENFKNSYGQWWRAWCVARLLFVL